MISFLEYIYTNDGFSTSKDEIGKKKTGKRTSGHTWRKGVECEEQVSKNICISDVCHAFAVTRDTSYDLKIQKGSEPVKNTQLWLIASRDVWSITKIQI